MRCILVSVCVLSATIGWEDSGWAGRIIASKQKISKALAETAVLALACTGLSCSIPTAPEVIVGRTDAERELARWNSVDAMPTAMANNWQADTDWQTVLGDNGLVPLFSGDASYSLSGHDPDQRMIVIEYSNAVKVVLTFDDGPDTRRGAVNGTRHVLDVLQGHDIDAVFFIQSHARSDSGGYFRGMEKTVGIPMVERMHDEGHIVAAHTGLDGKRAHAWANRHPRREARGELGEDLERSKAYIYARTGAEPRYVRPPFGEHNAAVRARYAAHDLTMVLWDIDSRDTRRGYQRAEIRKHLEHRVAQFVSRGRRSLVILFHDIDYDTYSGDNLHFYLAGIESAIDAQGFEAVFNLSRAELDDILAD